jgi:anti-sigma factor RsiW
LTDYLDGQLSPEGRAAFARHLDQCPACRLARDEQRGVDDLLRRAAAQDAPVPADLVGRIERRLRAMRRRRAAGCAAGLAAAVLAGVGLSAWLGRPTASTDPATAPTTPVEPREAVGRPPVVDVTVTSPAGIVAVPVRSRNSAVTILWVYPIRDAAPDRRAVADPPIPSDRSGL